MAHTKKCVTKILPGMVSSEFREMAPGAASLHATLSDVTPLPETEGVFCSEERMRATMVLAAAGDAIGYNKGAWEFCLSTTKIHRDLDQLTRGRGILALDCSHWMVSDDTVEHLATAEGLLRCSQVQFTLDCLLRNIAAKTKKAADDFTGRAPGKSEQQGIKLLESDGSNWASKPFDSRAIGCGAAMRVPCLGLIFHDDMQSLVAVSVEACRLTKTHPLGYLGGVCAAAFTAFALQSIPVLCWAQRLLDEVIPMAKEYVLQPGQRHLRENENAFQEAAFERKWKWYIHERGLDSGQSPQFPEVYDASERDLFYAECARMEDVNPSGKNPGSKGYDSVLIAFDALLWVETQLDFLQNPTKCWGELCLRAMLHRGDNDSTGSIAGAWYGALHGFTSVPSRHYESVEYAGRCDAAGRALYKLSKKQSDRKVLWKR